jgi:hypothetical protein
MKIPLMIKKIISSIFLAASLLMTPGCNLDVLPTDAISEASLAASPGSLESVLNGCYALFKDRLVFDGTIDDNNNYLRQYFQLSDFAADDIVCAQVTEDPFFYSFTYTHSSGQTNTRYLWYISYKVIEGANTVISIGEGISNPDETIQQYIGEAYFLRALAHFNLARLFAQPYTLAPSSPGDILRLSNTEPGAKARATVQETYDQVVNDLLKAAELLSINRGVQFASKEAAWALLSRVYLYREENTQAADYATKVIESGKFLLTSGDAYKTMYANALTSTETIFSIAYTSVDNAGKFGSIASMLYSDGNSGWGEEYASSSYREELGEHPEDIRWSYIVPLDDGYGGIATKNGIEIYYITKFSFQDGDPNLASPILLRYAEMYLNRAEAYAKMGNDAGALADVDEIRNNRGLENSLYNGAVPPGSTALDVVLKERRLELAFEGHRKFDLFRNKRNCDRTYWGYHIPGLTATDIDLSVLPVGYPNTLIEYSNPRIIYYIPEDELLANNLCVQNP